MKKTARIWLIANCLLLIAFFFFLTATQVYASCESAIISPPSGASFTLFRITATDCDPNKGYQFTVYRSGDDTHAGLAFGTLTADSPNSTSFSGTVSGINQTGRFVADVVETPELSLVASLEFQITEVRDPLCGEQVPPNFDGCPSSCPAVRDFSSGPDVWRCTSSAINQGGEAIPPPYVPCGQTRDPEFHSLRPYQASPCNPNLEDQNLTNYCANDFITQDKITVNYSSGSSCAQGSQSCRRFSVQRSLNIGINFDEASLPILGNTELVRNSQNAGSSPDSPSFLTPAQRMSNYVSWFLNGVLFRAEEKPLDPANQADIYTLVNFSGPINKLLPQDVKLSLRQKAVEAVNNLLRHNQIVTCREVSLTNPIPHLAICYTGGLLSGGVIAPIRIFNPDDPFSLLDEIIGSLLGDKSEEYVPLASTEDLLGESRIDTSTTPQQAGGEVNILNPSVNAPGNTILYFPHIEETTGLAKILQGTFASKDSLNINPPPEQRQMPQRCENVEVRANPGDDLFAENNIRPAGFAPQVPNETTGAVSYTAEFECVFSDYHPIRNPNPSCTKTASVAVPVLVRMPKADTLKQKLVDGQAGIAARFYPKTGPGTGFMEEGFKDIPGVSNASYYQLQGETPLAGDPSRQRPGSSAQVFFPGLGSIYDYFLNGIQKLLRPKDTGVTRAQLDQGVQPIGAECSALAFNIDFRDTSVLPNRAEKIIENLRRNNPGGFAGSTIEKAAENIRNRYAEILTRSRAAGYNPAFVIAIWLEETAASALPGLDFGCGNGNPNNFNSQLGCFLGLYDNWSKGGAYDSLVGSCRKGGDNPSFEDFLLFYAEGICSTVQRQNRQFCANHKNFPNRVQRFYDVVVGP